ncbi:hypothetical protein ARMGADRAFT_1012779 [Armillaria gallica]|uniref:Uncharacterized protein n=1 Tax=Armillaria gallica TaxID=47427 RepID=A0A2H3DD08_ARMGA|nr:hypothetical protein ARMGADRAFT_1012779 [Armillaria gallica]
MPPVLKNSHSRAYHEFVLSLPPITTVPFASTQCLRFQVFMASLTVTGPSASLLPKHHPG